MRTRLTSSYILCHLVLLGGHQLNKACSRKPRLGALGRPKLRSKVKTLNSLWEVFSAYNTGRIPPECHGITSITGVAIVKCW